MTWPQTKGFSHLFNFRSKNHNFLLQKKGFQNLETFCHKMFLTKINSHKNSCFFKLLQKSTKKNLEFHKIGTKIADFYF